MEIYETYPNRLSLNNSSIEFKITSRYENIGFDEYND